MRFLIDECTGPKAAHWLREQGYEIFSVFDEARGMDDDKIIKKGYSAVINGRFYAIKGPVYKIHRLRYADDIPMMYEERYISLAFCPDIKKKNLEQSLYDLYENVYDLTLTEVNQMLSATMIEEKKLKTLFNIERSIPSLLVEGVTFCGKEMVLEMEKSIYRGDKYRFSVRAT